MANKLARPLPSPRQKSGKSAKPANSGAAPAQLLKIGEAARELGVEAYVLRFWETQFPELRPHHTATKHRLYSEADLETLKLIKHLLYEEGFTIEGARKRVKELGALGGSAKAAANSSAPAKPARSPAAADKAMTAEMPSGAARQALIDIRRDLESIYQLLKD
jgi:DNA-binding transcriptional MerR regulator